MFTFEDLTMLMQLGKIYPCQIKLSPDGSKKHALFPEKPELNAKLTKKWSWWFNQDQVDPDLLIKFLNKGFNLALGLNKTSLVLDCDDEEAFKSIINLFENSKSSLVAEKSLSYTPENKRHHFFFKTNQELPYCTKLNFYGISGQGEVLGYKHLVYLNHNGWYHSPSNYKSFPQIDLNLLKEQQKNPVIESASNKVETSDNLHIPKGSRNKTLLSISAKLRNIGLNRATILSCLTTINRYHCYPPLPHDELKGITDWIANQKSTGLQPDFKSKLSELKIKEDEDGFCIV